MVVATAAVPMLEVPTVLAVVSPRILAVLAAPVGGQPTGGPPTCGHKGYKWLVDGKRQCYACRQAGWLRFLGQR